jgi:hypothetical protein
MDAQTLKLIELFIVNEINENLKTSFVKTELVHNHPPLRFKVDGCEYCQKMGNIFELP